MTASASNRLKLTKQRIRAFEQRYGTQATYLAAYAAFPLTLTTDLVYCLRETFLPECPWYAAADLLLSGLCTMVGYDLYEMETDTRRYLLYSLRDRFGESRVYEVERFMVAYLRHRIREENSDRPLILGEKPHWTSLACLHPGDAYKEIQQTLQQFALTEVNPKERFRLAALVESYDDFLDDFLVEQGFQHILLDWADRLAEGEPIDETADLVAQLVKAGWNLRLFEFDVATFDVELTDEVEQDEALQPFEFEMVTVNERGEVIETETRHALYFTELLAEEVPPIEMVAIPSGSFIMGSPENELQRYSDESPQHSVAVSPFFISKYPITQAQWQAVMGSNPAEFTDNPLNPVERVSWDDAKEFCNRLSKKTGREYRLPTEAEWEYACRAGTNTPFHFGETISTELANYRGTDWEYVGKVYPGNYGRGSKGIYREQTTPVGYFQVANNFGLSDMHGNVWEWCEDDWHETYENAPTDGRAWFSEESSNKVARGGSWANDPNLCRSACRFSLSSRGIRDSIIGFRVVCVAPRTT